MRKSAAPSQRKKFVSPFHGSDEGANLLQTTFAKPEPSANLLLTTFAKPEPSIGLFQKSLTKPASHVQPLQSLDSQANTILPEVDSDTRVFSVVYGKPSKKKHKTWEGDGFLEVGSKSLILKDADGKIMGRGSHNKTAELEEGSRVFVGSKEVELVDLHTGKVVISKRPASPSDKNDEEKPRYKKKQKKISKPIAEELKTFGLSSVQKTSFSLSSNCEPLVMPRPSEEHQWECNEDHLPVIDVQVENFLCQHLRPHQREGVLFLYRCITGIRSLDSLGAILADEMGLGKTLQCITLIWTLLRSGPYGGKPLAKRILIVTPSSLTVNWTNEFTKWLGSWRIKIFTVTKSNKLEDYKKNLGIPVIIVSYDQLVRNIEHVRNLDLDLIVCDEGHRLKNSNIKTTSMLSELSCRRRILLTGTPVQNDLQEFYTLANFVNPNCLGNYSEFRNEFEKPIEAGKEVGASPNAVEAGDRAAARLSSLTCGFILRRTQSVVMSYLPPRTDYVIFCSMSQVQDQFYSKAVDMWFEREVHSELGLASSGSFDHLSLIMTLKKICNHPVLVNQLGKERHSTIDDALSSILQSLPMCSNKNIDDKFINIATKFALLNSLLDEISSLKQKIIIVSSFTQTLDVIEEFCKEKGFSTARFDGSVPVGRRQIIVDNFNSSSPVNVLLLSSKAGGVGLNLIGASRLVLFDSDWNPATDLQAMARIWRQGQKRPVHIYRFLMCGTIEEKIFQRQLQKTGLSESIVDPSAISGVKLSLEELKDLFSYSHGCSTHNMLSCTCRGEGSVPGIPEDALVEKEPEDDRDCLVDLSGNSTVTEGTLRMNQLYLWEHHARPLSEDVLKEISLGPVGDKIEYLFRNKTI